MKNKIQFCCIIIWYSPPLTAQKCTRVTLDPGQCNFRRSMWLFLYRRMDVLRPFRCCIHAGFVNWHRNETRRWASQHITPVNKLVSMTWLLWALINFRIFTLHYIVQTVKFRPITRPHDSTSMAKWENYTMQPNSCDHRNTMHFMRLDQVNYNTHDDFV